MKVEFVEGVIGRDIYDKVLPQQRFPVPILQLEQFTDNIDSVRQEKTTPTMNWVAGKGT